jgi:hypothetical protein
MSTRLLSPLTTVSIVWISALAFYYSGVVSYERIPQSAGIVYILVSIALFTIGHTMGDSLNIARKRNEMPVGGPRLALQVEVTRLSPLVTLLALCGIVAAVLFGAEMIFVAGMDPFQLSGRRMLFVEREVTQLSRVATVIGAGGYFSLSACILCWEHLRLHQRVLWLLSPLLLSGFSILSAGRQTVFQMVLLLIFAILIRRSGFGGASRATTRTLTLGMIGAFALTLSYGVIVGRERNEPSGDVNRKELLLSIFDARFSPGADRLVETLSPTARDGATEALLYFSHEIPSFLVFLASAPPGPYFGLWELPFLARRLESANIISSTVDQRIGEVYSSFAQSGRFERVWQTWIRDLVLDFGTTGALLAVLLLGFGAGRVYSKCRRDMRLSSSFLYLGIQVCCAYSILIAPISDTLMFFYMAGALMIDRRSLKRIETRKPRCRELGATHATVG